MAYSPSLWLMAFFLLCRSAQRQLIILGSHSTISWAIAKKQSMFLFLHVLQIASATKSTVTILPTSSFNIHGVRTESKSGNIALDCS
jgi:hypothetical protein